ncbi:MAG: BON domain-containing protein [Gemmatimonadota bacterium]
MASIYRASRPRTSSLRWTLIGLTVGLAAGAAAAIWYRPVNRERARRLARRFLGQRDTVLRMAPLVRAVERLIAADARLAPLDLEAIAVSAGRIELHGWVPSRELRARAWRIARQAPGIETLINSILVHGEDDTGSVPTTA